MAAKVFAKVFIGTFGILLIWLGVTYILSPPQSCFLGLCLTSPLTYVSGIAVAVIGLFVLWLGVRI